MINSFLEALIIIGPLLSSIGYVTIAERKIKGSMQRIVGPNPIGQKNVIRSYHQSCINYNNSKHPVTVIYFDVETEK